MYKGPLTWREELSVSFAEIDRQHKEVVALAGRLHAALREGAPNSILAPLLRALSDASRSHFTSEEGLMLASGYPEYANHRDEHRKLLEQLGIVQQDVSAGYAQASDALAAFIRIWVEQHIRFSDKPLAAFLNRTEFPPVA